MSPDPPAADRPCADDAQAEEPRMEIDALVGVELGEMLEFLHDWLGGQEAALFDASLRQFVGTDGFDLEDLRAEMAGFAAHLIGTDGDLLLNGEPDNPRSRVGSPAGPR